MVKLIVLTSQNPGLPHSDAHLIETPQTTSIALPDTFPALTSWRAFVLDS